MTSTTDSGADGGKSTSKRIMDTMKEVTGASEDDIKTMLQICNGDVNLATEKLLERPFEKVVSKKDKRSKKDEERKHDHRDYSRDSKRAGPSSATKAPRNRSDSRGDSRGSRGPATAPRPVQSTAPARPTTNWATSESAPAQDPSANEGPPVAAWTAKPAAAAVGTSSTGLGPATNTPVGGWQGNFADRLRASANRPPPQEPVAPPEPEPETYEQPPPEEDPSSQSLPAAEPLDEAPLADDPSQSSFSLSLQAPEANGTTSDAWAAAPAPVEPPSAAAAPTPASTTPAAPVATTPPAAATLAPPAKAPASGLIHTEQPPAPSLPVTSAPGAEEEVEQVRLTFGNFSMGGQTNDFGGAFVPGAFGASDLSKAAGVNGLLAGSRIEEPKQNYTYPSAIADSQVPQPKAPQDTTSSFAPQAPSHNRMTTSYPYSTATTQPPAVSYPGFDFKTLGQSQAASNTYSQYSSKPVDSFGAGFGAGFGVDSTSSFAAASAPAVTASPYNSLPTDIHGSSATSTLSSLTTPSTSSATPAAAVVPPARPTVTTAVPDYSSSVAAANRYQQPMGQSAVTVQPPPQPPSQQPSQPPQPPQPPAPQQQHPASSAPTTSYTAASSEPATSLPAAPSNMMQYGNTSLPSNLQYPGGMQYQYPFYPPGHGVYYNPYSHYPQVGGGYPQASNNFPPAAVAATGSYSTPSAAHPNAALRNFSHPFNTPMSGSSTQGYSAHATHATHGTHNSHAGHGHASHGYTPSQTSYGSVSGTSYDTSGTQATGYASKDKDSSQYGQVNAASSASSNTGSVPQYQSGQTRDYPGHYGHGGYNMQYYQQYAGGHYPAQNAQGTGGRQQSANYK